MEKEQEKIIADVKELIDELKVICNEYGLSNTGSEYKIITEVFLYKFLNDKFLNEIKKVDEKFSSCKNSKEVEKVLEKIDNEKYEFMLLGLGGDIAKLRKNHLISYLFAHQNDSEFYHLFDDTLIDIANYNIDVFSVKTSSNEKIKLFDRLSNLVVETTKKNGFCKAIINKLINKSFERLFEQKYDAFAVIFEYLLKDYNKDFGQYAEYYTPNSIARIIARILVKDNENVNNVTIYDPSAGSGTLLLALAHQIGEENCSIYSQDISQKSNEFLRLNLILNKLVHSLGNIVHANTLTEPKHYNEQKNRLAQFDYIVSNPPFKCDFSSYRDSLANSNNQERFFAGVPNIPANDKSKMAIYLMFIQHILYSLKENGKAAIVVPTGFITAQTGMEKKIREKLVNEKMLKGVISMPSNIFATTGTNVSVLFIDKSNINGNVLLVDASKLGEKVKEDKNQKTVLREYEIERIIDTFANKKVIDDFSVEVSYEKLKEKNCSFSAGQYFDLKIEYIELTNHKINLNKYFNENKRLEEELNKNLEELKYE